MKIGALEFDHPIALAPMEDVTDTSFRIICLPIHFSISIFKVFPLKLWLVWKIAVRFVPNFMSIVRFLALNIFPNSSYYFVNRVDIAIHRESLITTGKEHFL